MSESQQLPILGQAPAKHIDYAVIREKLANARGPRYWQTLEQLADDPEFRSAVASEFPAYAEVLDPVSRRDFLKLASVTLALAGITACTKQPLEPIVPYVRQPEGVTLGKPLYFATAMPLSGILRPLLVKSNEGRPTKVEGNAQHPASLGGSSMFTQGSIYDLYDPDRSQTINFLGDVRTWSAFIGAMRGVVNAQRALGGAGVRFLTGTTTSPSFAAQFKALQQQMPQAKWYCYEPINRDHVKLGAQQAFGRIVETTYKLDAADVIVSLDADFLNSTFPGFEVYARQFASRRQPDDSRGMSRFYAIETAPTNTGAKADHRLGLRPSEFEQFSRALASGGGSGRSGGGGQWSTWISAIAKDLQQHRATSVIIPGDHASPAVHALAHAMNAALGNVGKTVFYSDPVEPNPAIQINDLKALVDELKANKVDLLVMSGVNPCFDAPADLEFAKWIGTARLRVHHGLYADETSGYCHWHIPAAHYLESWSDGRSFDGTVSIVQPLIAPLYGGKTEHELLAAFGENPDLTAYEIIRGYWQSQHRGPDFETFWRRSLYDGFMQNSAPAPRTLTARPAPSAVPGPQQIGPIEVVFRPDPTIYDGRFGNNAWLQEMDKPLTTMTWENCIWVSAAMAERMKLAPHNDVVELEVNGRKIRGGAFVQPGMPDNCVAVFTGYGHTHIGHTGNGFGYNAHGIRTSDAPWFATVAKLTKTGESIYLAKIQPEQIIAAEWGMESRHVLAAADLETYKRDPKFAHNGAEEPTRDDTLYPNYSYNAYAWGMSIDMNKCVGCNTCIVACQAENNIPVVGKSQVLFRRAMHWLRVDTYYEGSLDNPRVYFQPLPCMQCENAPCEYVCPVAATVHSTEGLNDMVYNRCVGTRYCSNNCPYKVRRFNFLLYQDWTTPQLKLMRNPDVSVRSRGVMEKCTYCIQRITHARIEAEKQDRVIRDGEFTTACAQACPADAIVFGNLNDPQSRAGQLRRHDRNYSLLADLNTRPRTTYMAAVTNPNPELQAGGGQGTSEHS